MIKIIFKNICEIKGIFLIKYIYIFSQHNENTHVEVFTACVAQTHTEHEHVENFEVVVLLIVRSIMY